ncbi:MAG: hypothetical protein R3F59_24620 [Myxococcota bacterium]
MLGLLLRQVLETTGRGVVQLDARRSGAKVRVRIGAVGRGRGHHRRRRGARARARTLLASVGACLRAAAGRGHAV